MDTTRIIQGGLLMIPSRQSDFDPIMKLPRRVIQTLLLFIILALLPACGKQPSVIAPPPVFITFTPTVISTSTPPPTPTLIPVERSIGASVPQLLREQAQAVDGDLSLDISPSPAPEMAVDETRIRWVYVLAAPFATLRDGVSSRELRDVWEGGASHPLLMEDSTRAAFTAQWGEPGAGSVRSVPADQLLDAAWAGSAWVILPFESLEARWKVLTIDGQSPVRKGFSPANYPLTLEFSLHASTGLQPSNYDPGKLATVVVTGTTALVRATAYRMEKKGITYPGEEVRDLMREADIAHVSNEVSFFSDCPYPNPNSGRLIFCSAPKNIGLLTDIGVDVVELTGNHFADYGNYAMEETLALYRSKDLDYYGGGSNYQDSLKPVLFEVNGNRIAFLGCNLPDAGKSNIATDDHPGSAPCDFDHFTAEVAELKSQGWLVIFTFQWGENYVPEPDAGQMEGFRRMVDAGAVVVSGSQAHFPKTMEFYNGAFIHYGLGNLFFDQMGNFDWMPAGIRREFLDRYVFYDGRLVSVELITTLLEDFARPRIMTPQERSAFLQEYFLGSGWQPVVDEPGILPP